MESLMTDLDDIDPRQFYEDPEATPSLADWLMRCGTSGFDGDREAPARELIRFAQASLIRHQGPDLWPWEANTSRAFYRFSGMVDFPVWRSPASRVWSAYANWLGTSPDMHEGEWADKVLREFPVKKPVLMLVSRRSGQPR